MSTVAAIFESDYKGEFEKLGIWYEHRLIDDVSVLWMIEYRAQLYSNVDMPCNNRWSLK